MFQSRTAKRARAIVIALAVTFASNYAISFAAKPDNAVVASNSSLQQSSARSGGTGNKMPGCPPPPNRSGGTGNKMPGCPPPALN
jgi:hypothetical protein